MILLDTHPLIWFTQGHDRLGDRARQIMEAKIKADAVKISPITFWETSMLVQKGRVTFEQSILDWMHAILGKALSLAEMSPEIAISAGELPGSIHGDPADRLIIATARTLGCPLLTADRQILAYGAAGHVAVIDARH